MSELVTPAVPTAPEPEPAEMQERNTWVGTRMLAAATTFLFLGFVFAYLYLASLDTAGMWRPSHVKAPIGWGLAVTAAIVVAAALVAYARSDLSSGQEDLARDALLGGLVAGVAAIVLQAVEYSHLSFGPADGGFASVFVGWSGLLMVVVFGTMLWLEIVVASRLRAGNGEAAGRSDLDAVGFFLSFVAGLGVLTFVFLYLL